MDEELKKQILQEEREKLEDLMYLNMQLVGMLCSVKESIGDVTISEALNRTEEIMDYLWDKAEEQEETIESEFAMHAFELKQKELIEQCLSEVEKQLDEEEI